MAKTKLSIREQSRLLVQSILNKQTLSANKILDRLITEAEQQREKAIYKLILQQDEELDEGGDEDLDLGDEDVDEDLQDGDDSGDELAGQEEEVTQADVDNKVDDALQIQCEINAKRITSMFDSIAELKQALDEKGLDVNSKEYIKSEVSIQYYSDKLQEFQGKTNPGVDQAKLEEALDKIFEALEQLKGQLGVQGGEDVDTDIDSPEEVGGDVDEDTEDTEDTEDSGDEDLYGDEDLEGDEDLDEQSEDEDFQEDEQLEDEQI